MEDDKKLIHRLLRTASSSTRASDFARIQKVVALLTITAVACLVMYFASFNDFGPPRLRFSSLHSIIGGPPPLTTGVHLVHDDFELRRLLEAASMADRTVILTTLNEAWAEPNSIFDYFLESFRIGNNTARLLRHVLVICYDRKAYLRCQEEVTHCFFFRRTLSVEMAHEAVFMSPTYVKMMWERLAFLQSILSIGYNFVFTDTDVMWLRDPFPHFSPSMDIQTSCDRFNGRPFDLNNHPNNGFSFVRSSNRTVEFYKYWVTARLRFPALHDQDAFNKIKHEPFLNQIGLKIQFLDTDYFGGFCRPSKDFNKVCTMHANCCVGLGRKITDLNTTLSDWKRFVSKGVAKWRVPRQCKTSWTRIKTKSRSLVSVVSDLNESDPDS